ncbi:MAG: glycine cleavage T C-terminal barrel domain-containing protein, partial [Gammaproteobacteria bacterium]|nr:glycine cleavage T C-terminal barrel domain-containing protein [Gammaproteobacteria bacterium]
EWQARGFNWRFVTMELLGIVDADARGSEPIYLGDKLVGRCTSGGFGWRTGKSLALAMVDPAVADEDTKLEVQILGERFQTQIIPESPFDPDNQVLQN